MSSLMTILLLRLLNIAVDNLEAAPQTCCDIAKLDFQIWKTAMLISDRDLRPVCYDYTRVSGHDQGQNGLSLGVQNGDLKRYHDMFLPDVPYGSEKYDSGRRGLIVDRGISAWSQDLFIRPGGRVMSRALKPGDHVCFTRLDRGFRSVNDFSKVLPIWQARNISVHFVDQNLNLGSANGKLMAHMLVALAQWESDMKSERVKLAIAQMRLMKEKGVDAEVEKRKERAKQIERDGRASSHVWAGEPCGFG